MLAAALLIGAYLLGSVPFGLLIGWSRGVDVRRAGSGNIGATNVGRVCGRKWGYLCLLLDVLKGLLPALAAGSWLVPEPPTVAAVGQWIAVGAAAVVGHTLPIYLGFRGGKGVATTVGVALGVYPYFTVAMAAALVAYGLIRFTTGLVSAGSLAIAVVFPVGVWVYVAVQPEASMAILWPLQVVAVLLGLLIIVRHRSNIVRLMRGEESRMSSPPADG